MESWSLRWAIAWQGTAAYAKRRPCVGVENWPGLGAIDDLLHMPEEMSWQAALCYDPCQFAAPAAFGIPCSVWETPA